MADVWLATCAELPDGGAERILPELFAQRGVSARWAVWDDPTIDWSRADLVAIRTTWDYAARLGDFLRWVTEVSHLTRLVNHADIIAWNTDKIYLQDLAAWGIPVVPTQVAVDGAELESLLLSHDSAVVKPAVGVGGIGLVVWHPGHDVPAVASTVVVQPLIESVRSSGETSIFVMGGRAVAQVVKHPVDDEVRVHEEYGGASVAAPLDPDLAALAEAAISSTADRFATSVPYGRVDLLHHEGSWLVSELEITEPGLYVDVDSRIAEAYVDAIAGELGR